MVSPRWGDDGPESRDHRSLLYPFLGYCCDFLILLALVSVLVTWENHMNIIIARVRFYKNDAADLSPDTTFSSDNQVMNRKKFEEAERASFRSKKCIICIVPAV